MKSVKSKGIPLKLIKKKLNILIEQQLSDSHFAFKWRCSYFNHYSYLSDIRVMVEIIFGMQKHVHLYPYAILITPTINLYRVKHGITSDILYNSQVPDKEINLINNIYTQQKTTVIKYYNKIKHMNNLF